MPLIELQRNKIEFTEIVFFLNTRTKGYKGACVRLLFLVVKDFTN